MQYFSIKNHSKSARNTVGSMISNDSNHLFDFEKRLVFFPHSWSYETGQAERRIGWNLGGSFCHSWALKMERTKKKTQFPNSKKRKTWTGLGLLGGCVEHVVRVGFFGHRWSNPPPVRACATTSSVLVSSSWCFFPSSCGWGAWVPVTMGEKMVKNNSF